MNTWSSMFCFWPLTLLLLTAQFPLIENPLQELLVDAATHELLQITKKYIKVQKNVLKKSSCKKKVYLRAVSLLHPRTRHNCSLNSWPAARLRFESSFVSSRYRRAQVHPGIRLIIISDICVRSLTHLTCKGSGRIGDNIHHRISRRAHNIRV